MNLPPWARLSVLPSADCDMDTVAYCPRRMLCRILYILGHYMQEYHAETPSLLVFAHDGICLRVVDIFYFLTAGRLPSALSLPPDYETVNSLPFPALSYHWIPISRAARIPSARHHKHVCSAGTATVDVRLNLTHQISVPSRLCANTSPSKVSWTLLCRQVSLSVFPSNKNR